VEGASRFLRRLWSLAVTKTDVLTGAGISGVSDARSTTTRREIHATLKKARFDYERRQFNTVVSGCMTMVNALYRLDDSPAGMAVLREGLSIVLRLLGPIAPHITHELWRDLDYGEDILDADWPMVDETALRQDTIEYVVQVNGRVRGKIRVAADAGRGAVEQAALASENVRRFVGEAQVRKIILVPRKLVNVVAH